MIDVHVCAQRKEGLIKLAETMLIENRRGESLVSLGCTLKVIYDPATIAQNDLDKFSFVEMAPQRQFGGTPPLFAIRRQIHNFKGGQPWMIFDDDDYFVDDSVEYLQGCVNFINTFEKLTGRNCFLGTASFFGSNHHSDLIHISPSNAIMPKGHGLIFSAKIDMADGIDNKFARFDSCIGGFEEMLFASIATKYFDAVPFKRFLNPSFVRFRKEKDRDASPIHNYDTWRTNSHKFIRELSGDNDWKYPHGMGDSGTKSPKPWIKRAKRLKEEFGL